MGTEVASDFNKVGFGSSDTVRMGVRDFIQNLHLHGKKASFIYIIHLEWGYGDYGEGVVEVPEGPRLNTNVQQMFMPSIITSVILLFYYTLFLKGHLFYLPST